jgi:hypothetical protein
VTGPFPLYTRMYDGLGTHNSLSMSFTLYQLDSLDSQDGFGYDTVNVYVDNVFIPMWTQSQYQIKGPSTCGASDIDIILPIYITAPHSATSVTIKFDAFFDQDSTDESYGFRDIHIALSTTSPALSASICGTSSLIPYENQCKCSIQQYYNETTASCVECDVSCDTCTGSGPQYCIKCSDSYSMSAGGCISRCSLGYYYMTSQSKCVPCAVDTFSGNSFPINNCPNCPVGYSTNGAIGQSVCGFCTDGYYKSVDSSCKPVPVCNSGKYFDINNEVCALCANSKYQPSSTAQATACTVCPAGYTTGGNMGQASCAYCSSTYYRSADNTCKLILVCGSGKYFDKTDEKCTICPIDQYQSDSNSPVITCTACTVGYSTNGNQGQATCTYCAFGYYMSSDNTCKSIPVCGGGKYFNTASEICASCPVNKYQPGTSSQSVTCIDCPVGRTTNNALSQTSCDYCDFGYYMSADTTCKVVPICNVGRYFNTSLETCQTCSIDHYQSQTSTPVVSCSLCATGYTTEGMTGQATCNGCALNFYKTSMNLCKPVSICGLGSFFNTSSETCQQCAINTYQSSSTSPTLSCTQCQVGYTTNNRSGQISCTYCDIGYYQSAANTCSQIPVCGAGSFFNITSAMCQTCPLNTYQSDMGAQATLCNHCELGYTTDSRVGQTTCNFCDSGYYLSNVNTCLQIPVCGAGSFFNITSAACHLCAVDTYQSSSNNAKQSCDACTIGYNTNNQIGASTCGYCSNGYYSSASETCTRIPVCGVGNYFNLTNFICQNCDFDTYQASPTSQVTLCPQCPVGYTTSNKTAQSSCRDCAVNYYMSPTNTCSQIPVCGPGSYFNITQNACQFCEKDYYQCKNDPVTTCKACTAGYTTNGDIGQSKCNYCAPSYYHIESGKCASILICGQGSYFDVDTNMCQQCDVDTYQPRGDVQAAKCTLCPTGSSTFNKTGAMGCNYCYPGYYAVGISPSSGVLCELCDVDSYKDTFNADPTCITCPSSASTGGKRGASEYKQCGFCRKGTYMELGNAETGGKKTKSRSFYCF